MTNSPVDKNAPSSSASTTERLAEAKRGGFDYPWLTHAGEVSVRGLLPPGETLREAFERVATHAARILSEMSPKYSFEKFKGEFLWALENNYICLASPIIANFGTGRGLPASCFGQTIGDSIYDIKMGELEFALLSKNGGGVSQNMSYIRPAKAPIKGGQNGVSNGSLYFAKGFDTTVASVSQGGTRKGANALQWSVEHGDRWEVLSMRREEGNKDTRCLNSNHAFIFSDNYMNGLLERRNKDDMDFWAQMIKTRIETGEPYLFFEDNANRLNPVLRGIYDRFGLRNRHTNICTEILLPGDFDHTFVCIILSVNAANFEEWKDKGVARLAMFLLEAVTEDFLRRARLMPGFEKAVRFVEKARAVGVGCLGFQTLLQRKGIPFISLGSRSWTNIIHKHLRDETDEASREMARDLGEPLWCTGTGFRHTHRLAVAPTATNAIISGQVSFGIEPWAGNSFPHKVGRGTFIVRNRELTAVLEGHGKNDEETWRSITLNKGSVQHLPFLSPEEKEVFKIASEIDQLQLVELAAVRDQYLDQGQSLNLFFDPPRRASGETPEQFAPRFKAFMKHVSDVHVHAWRVGLRTLYYLRSTEAYSGDTANRGHKRNMGETKKDGASESIEVEAPSTSCIACEG